MHKRTVPKHILVCGEIRAKIWNKKILKKYSPASSLFPCFPFAKSLLTAWLKNTKDCQLSDTFFYIVEDCCLSPFPACTNIASSFYSWSTLDCVPLAYTFFLKLESSILTALQLRPYLLWQKRIITFCFLPKISSEIMFCLFCKNNLYWCDVDGLLYPSWVFILILFSYLFLPFAILFCTCLITPCWCKSICPL